jgi:hypothetical protein
MFLHATCCGCTTSYHVYWSDFLDTTCRGCTASLHVYLSDSRHRASWLNRQLKLYARITSRTALWLPFVFVFVSAFSVVSSTLIQKLLCNFPLKIQRTSLSLHNLTVIWHLVETYALAQVLSFRTFISLPAFSIFLLHTPFLSRSP